MDTRPFVLLLAAALLAACGGNGGPVASGTPFSCGSITCQPGYYCQDLAQGVVTADGGVLPDMVSCQAVPASCLPTPTCDCLGKALPDADCAPIGADNCTEDSGHVTVSCEAT